MQKELHYLLSTLTNTGLQKEFQAVGDQQDLKVDTNNVKYLANFQ